MVEVGSFDANVAKFSFYACVSQHTCFLIVMHNAYVRGEQGWK